MQIWGVTKDLKIEMGVDIMEKLTLNNGMDWCDLSAPYEGQLYTPRESSLIEKQNVSIIRPSMTIKEVTEDLNAWKERNCQFWIIEWIFWNNDMNYCDPSAL